MSLEVSRLLHKVEIGIEDNEAASMGKINNGKDTPGAQFPRDMYSLARCLGDNEESGQGW